MKKKIAYPNHTEVYEWRTFAPRHVVHKIYYRRYKRFKDLPEICQTKSIKKEYYKYWRIKNGNK